MFFISPSMEKKLGLKELLQQLHEYIKEEPESQYKVVIGTDSQTTLNNTIYVTALIILRIGKGAKLFFTKQYNKPVFDLRNRIYTETQLSLLAIHTLMQHGFSEIASKCPIEIHLDVGNNGETKKLIQEIVGWVSAVGFTARIKPDSYGASSVADRFTKHHL